MRLLTLLPRLDGPPPSLPHLLDLASDRWWGLPPRGRLAAGGLAACLLVLAVALPRLTDDEPGRIEVLVAARDLPAGHGVGPDDLRTEHRSADHVPDRPVHDPAAGTLVGVLPEGAVLAEAHLRPGGLGALVAEGHLGLALPTTLVADDVHAGADVEVVTTDEAGSGAPPTALGTVLRVDAEQVWVEVAEADAARIARAAARSAVAVVVRPVDDADDADHDAAAPAHRPP